MRIVKIHKFFITLFAALALAITPSISFATAPQEVENCLNTANSIQDPDQRDAALSACLTNAPFEMTFERVGTSMNTVEFTIAAKGTFYVFCGGAAAVHFGMRGYSSDVSVTEISMSAGRIGKTVQNTDDPITYQCVWAQNKSEVTIKIDGRATAYSANSTVASFSVQDSQSALNNKVNLAEIDGSLGAVFPTLTTGTRKQPSFYQSFKGCSNLTGSISSDLFDGIVGDPVSNMFQETFSGCTSLTGPIPSGLFSGITGTAASVFQETFYNCENLQGPLPNGLFRSITGAGAANVFNATFFHTGLTGGLPEDFFGNFTSVGSGMFENMFSKSENFGDGYFIHKETFAEELSVAEANSGIDVISAMNGMFGGTAFATSCPSGYMAWHPTPNDYTLAWEGKVACTPIPEFTVTTSETNLFKFAISANGVFNVDCGDGGSLQGNSGTGSSINVNTITRNNATSPVIYWCSYDNSAVRIITFSSSSVTGYLSQSYPAIRFGYSGETDDLTADKVVRISGNLGGVFPVISAGVTGTPRFSNTFSNCENLTGSISGLFDGIVGAPITKMFLETFKGCRNLTGTIPSELFSGVSGAPATSMFQETFSGCSGLTGSIPNGLFSGIADAAINGAFYGTFKNCSGLTGSVPTDLFGNITPNTTSYATIQNYGGTLNSTTFYGAMQDMFAGTNLDTCCSTGGAVTTTDTGSYSWASLIEGDNNNSTHVDWGKNNGLLVVACDANLTNNQCMTPCEFANNLRVGAYSFALKKRDSNPITAEKTLNVKKPGAGETETCYVPFSSTEPASINNNDIRGILAIKVNGTTYYAEPSN